jgi:hypothetical protein
MTPENGAEFYRGGQLVGSTGTHNSVPEPATMLLLGLGLTGIAGVRRKLKK